MKRIKGDIGMLIYDVLQYSQNYIYYLLEKDIAVSEIKLTDKEL